jgi:hypothetical protein
MPGSGLLRYTRSEPALPFVEAWSKEVFSSATLPVTSDTTRSLMFVTRGDVFQIVGAPREVRNAVNGAEGRPSWWCQDRWVPASQPPMPGNAFCTATYWRFLVAIQRNR